MTTESAETKCLVLGANGFVGGNLCKGLLAVGYKVRAFSRQLLDADWSIGESDNFENIIGDFGNAEDLRVALSGVDVVFHLISSTLPQSSNNDPVFDVTSNVGGTVKLLELMKESNVNKILFVSSGGTVYGKVDSVSISESEPTKPICSYGVSKVAIENYLYMYRELYGLEYFVFRLSNPFGIGRKIGKPQGVINSFLASCLSHKTIEIWGDGSVVRDYIYIDDVVAACIKALNLDEWKGDILNIGSGEGASLKDILAVIETAAGQQTDLQYKNSRNFDVPFNVLDISHAKQILDWAPKTSLSDGVLKTKEWLEGRN
jgi:UDP-glucose 4-epimerase